jgi:type IV secretion system protein VirB4
MDILAESCPTKVFLANYEAGTETQREQYRALGLNSKQIEIIAHAVPKQDYYVVSRDGRRLMQLALGKQTLAFVGVSGKEDLAQVRHLLNRHGADWIEHWLDYKQAV